MSITAIKTWLEDCITLLETNPPDTVPIRIQENRIRWGAPYRMREEIKNWVTANKPAALPYLVELKTWMEDYFHYFDEGFRPISGETIDTLPAKILERLKWIRERIESL